MQVNNCNTFYYFKNSCQINHSCVISPFVPFDGACLVLKKGPTVDDIHKLDTLNGKWVTNAGDNRRFATKKMANLSLGSKIVTWRGRRKYFFLITQL